MYNTCVQGSSNPGGSRRIAVVGSGVAGMGAAWLLSRHHDVTVYEREARIGGHTHTVTVDDGGDPLPVDTGFIVFNRPNYPQLTRLFERLDVQTRPTCMSFSASIDGGRVEYAGTSIATLFAQPLNLFRPAFHRMLRDVLRFNREAGALAEDANGDGPALGEFLRAGRYGEAFRDWYLLPMAAAIWSCPTATMLSFPARSLACFFRNHGLLSVNDRPQWRSVDGGSHSYIRRMLADLGDAVHPARAAVAVRREGDRVQVLDDAGRRADFDDVVLACHADQALALLERPSDAERRILGAFRYQRNRVLLHTDTALMPRRRAVWSSWNYLGTRGVDGNRAVSVSYWMNRLQALRAKRDYFVSLNPVYEPAAGAVLRELEYTHPVFDTAAMAAQPELASLQGRRRTWFCGSYHGYGFHEDALASAVRVADGLGVAAPWSGAEAAPRTAPASGVRPGELPLADGAG